MKNVFLQLGKLRLFVAPVSLLMLCSWNSPCIYDCSRRPVQTINDTLPKEKQDEFEKAMKEVDKSMAEVNRQMKNVKVNADKEIQQAIASIDFAAIQKQTEESLKQIDWAKMQQDVNISMQKAQAEVAKVDFAKLQNQMKELQDKFNSDEFKAQFNTEKVQQQIQASMEQAKVSMQKAKVSMDKAKRQLQQMKDFTDALAADGLIDKKKGYSIEWKDGDLYINNQKQPKDVSDKYKKYENPGKIKMLPDGAEHF